MTKKIPFNQWCGKEYEDYPITRENQELFNTAQSLYYLYLLDIWPYFGYTKISEVIGKDKNIPTIIRDTYGLD